MGNIKKVQNHEYHVSEESREETDIVTDVTAINEVNTGSDHRMVISNMKLDIEVESKQWMIKRPPRVNAAQIRSTSN